MFPNCKFLVKCSDGLLLVNDYQMKNGYIKTGKTFNNGKKDFTFLKKNKFGFFDLEE